MQKKIIKRGSAYLIDIFIISLLLLFCNILFETKNMSNLSLEMNKTYELYLSEKISFDEYFTNYSNLAHQYDQSRLGFTFINVALILLFFIIIPYLNKGQTIGLKIFKLKIKERNDSNLKISSLILRNIIVNGLLYLVLLLIILFIFDGKIYFVLNSILGFSQILLVICSTFVLIYRKDNYGFQDMISKTEIVEMNEG